MSDTMREDIELIRNVAGDLDHGFFDSGKKIRGNIGGPVSRACDRLEAALSTRPANAQVDAGWNSNLHEEIHKLTMLWCSSNLEIEQCRTFESELLHVIRQALTAAPQGEE